MNENKKINWVLWIGLAIPAITLIFVAIFSYIPNGFTEKYDFLYYFSDYSSGYCNYYDAFSVKDRKISINTNNTAPIQRECKNVAESDSPKIYRFNVSTNQRTQISFTDAQRLKIDNNVLSPDDISVQRGSGYSSGMIELFGGVNNYNTMYLKDGDGKLKKIDLDQINSYNFHFIGWVLN